MEYIKGVCGKSLKATLLFVDFSKAFDSIQKRKMEQIRLAFGLPKENVTAIKMLYENMKAKVCSPDGNTDFFDIVAGVLQGNTWVSYLFIFCLGYVLWMSIDIIKENGFTLKKVRSRWYPAETITDVDDADDKALLANTPTRAESLLYSLE